MEGAEGGVGRGGAGEEEEEEEEKEEEKCRLSYAWQCCVGIKF